MKNGKSKKPGAPKPVGTRPRVDLGPYQAITEPPKTYRLPPPGEYAAKVIHAGRSTVPWRATSANPRGDCMTLRLSVGQEYGLVFVDVPDGGASWLAKAVAAAVGIVPDLFWYADKLHGKHARVVIAHHTGKNGFTKAVVAKWLPATVSMPRQTGGENTLTDAIDEWARGGEESPPKLSRNAVPQHGADDDLAF